MRGLYTELFCCHLAKGGYKVNAFNRLVTILLILAVMISLTVFLIVPKPIMAALKNGADNLYQRLDLYNDLILLGAGVVLTVIIDVIGAFVLFLEIRRPRVKAIKVQKVSGGEAVVAVESIAKRLSYHIDQLPDVISARPNISARGGSIEVDLEVEISPEIDIPMKDEEIRQVATHVVEEQMGLKLRKIRPSFKDGPYPRLPTA
jgi:uncharacterized alkaline shock family protein YloU